MKKQANKVLALTCKPAFWLDAVRRTGRLPGKEEPPITVEGTGTIMVIAIPSSRQTLQA